MDVFGAPVAAIAAPAAGAGIEAIGALLLIVAFVVLLGLGQAWRSTIGWALNKLADLLDGVSISVSRVTVRPFGSVAAALRAISHNVWVAINYAALKCENGFVWLVDQIGNQIRWMGHEIAELAHSTFRGIDAILTRDIPDAVRRGVRPVAQRLHGIDRTLGRLEAQARAQWKRLHAGIDRLNRVVTRTIPARFRGIEAKARSVTKRLSRVERLLGAAAFATATAVALRRLGLGFLRCGNFRRAGKQLCGVDPALLEGLLGTTLLLTSALSLREFARDLEEPTALVMDGVRKLIREL